MPNENNNYIVPIVLGVGGLIIANNIISRIFDKSQEQRDNEAAATGNAWQPNYWRDYALKNGGYVHIIGVNGAKFSAQQIYNALRHVIDDDDVVINIFQQLNYKTQVSYLADIFQQQYGKSLYTYLLNGGGWSWASGMKDTNLAIINKLVNKMQNG
jgi:hypothetical protein